MSKSFKITEEQLQGLQNFFNACSYSGPGNNLEVVMVANLLTTLPVIDDPKKAVK